MFIIDLCKFLMQIRSVVYGVWFLFCCLPSFSSFGYFMYKMYLCLVWFGLVWRMLSLVGGVFSLSLTNRDRNFSGFVKLGDSEIKWWHMHSFDHVIFCFASFMSCPLCHSLPWSLIKVDWLDWIYNTVEYRTRLFLSVFPFRFIDFFLICREVYSLTASLRFNKLNVCVFCCCPIRFTSTASRWKWQVLTKDFDICTQSNLKWTGFSCGLFFSLSLSLDGRSKAIGENIYDKSTNSTHTNKHTLRTTFVPHVTWVYSMLIEFTIRILRDVETIIIKISLRSLVNIN